MRYKSFGEYVDKKKRDSLRQLGLIKEALERSGLKTLNHLHENTDGLPYIFCANPLQGSGVGGIRIYKIGEQFAFRIQKEGKTHPYGSAYPLKIEQMFNDFLSDEGVDEMKAGKLVIEHLVKEIKSFFEKSMLAEKEERAKLVQQDKNSAGNVLIRSTGTDYSSLIYQK